MSSFLRWLTLGSTSKEVEHLPALASGHGRLVLHNDNATPMDFVVKALTSVLGCEEQRAVKLMFRTHFDGRVVCGDYPVEIAEAKVAQFMTFAKTRGYPIRLTMEKE